MNVKKLNESLNNLKQSLTESPVDDVVTNIKRAHGALTVAINAMEKSKSMAGIARKYDRVWDEIESLNKQLSALLDKEFGGNHKI